MALLSEALLNRGFRVETQRSTILLTSEMVLPGDARVLQTCLRRLGLDSALTPWPVDTLPFRLRMPDQPLSTTDMDALFEGPHVESCVELPTGIGGDRFRRNRFRPRIPLTVLDPRIALLVKALSAVGCETWSSCQGRHARDVRSPPLPPVLGGGSCPLPSAQPSVPLHMEFIDEVNAEWARHLLNDASRNGIVCEAIQVNGSALCETPQNQVVPSRDLTGLWEAAAALGRFIFHNRQRLRETREAWISSHTL